MVGVTPSCAGSDFIYPLKIRGGGSDGSYGVIDSRRDPLPISPKEDFS